MTTDSEDKPARPGEGTSREVDLGEVSRLVEALERDLDQVRAGTGGVETLRGEVERLRAALQSPERAEPGVEAGLDRIRALLHRAGDELLEDAVKASEYITRIGRMLGL
ncbi:MAG: hypothetical protein KJ025_15305 [Burkholderiales bacterium]|nr:hypothetical protein [Burkholderiales bacterium]